MADRALKKSWRRDARKQHPDSLQDQKEWLEVKRGEYKSSLDEGDWEMNSSSFEGGSSSGKRGLSAKANHDAILAALEELEEQLGEGVSTKGAIVIPTFSGILN